MKDRGMKASSSSETATKSAKVSEERSFYTATNIHKQNFDRFMDKNFNCVLFYNITLFEVNLQKRPLERQIFLKLKYNTA